MAGPFGRFLVQALVIGSGYFIKAFVQAYQKVRVYVYCCVNACNGGFNLTTDVFLVTYYKVAANPEAAKAAAEAAKKSGASLLRKEVSESKKRKEKKRGSLIFKKNH